MCFPFSIINFLSKNFLRLLRISNYHKLYGNFLSIFLKFYYDIGCRIYIYQSQKEIGPWKKYIEYIWLIGKQLVK